MSTLQITSTSPSSTKRIAAQLASLLKPPYVLLLEGDLGSGKTTFVSGFVEGLQQADPIQVQSPTFALARTYETIPRVHHIDLYRLHKASSLAELGLLDLIDDTKAFVLVEWPNNCNVGYPAHAIRVSFPSNISAKRKLKFTIPDDLNINLSAQ